MGNNTTKELERVRQRLDIVLAHAGGLNVSDVAESVGVSRPTARKWIRRYEAAGIPPGSYTLSIGTYPDDDTLVFDDYPRFHRRTCDLTILQ